MQVIFFLQGNKLCFLSKSVVDVFLFAVFEGRWAHFMWEVSGPFVLCCSLQLVENII